MNDDGDCFDFWDLFVSLWTTREEPERNTTRRVLYLDWQKANVSIIGRRLYWRCGQNDEGLLLVVAWLVGGLPMGWKR